MLKFLNIYEFLDILYDSPRRWIVNPRGQIRTSGVKMEADCPWSYARKRGSRYAEWTFDVKAVWAAADRRFAHKPEIRAALLHACGLTEQKPRKNIHQKGT
jgi:hypothetical protein